MEKYLQVLGLPANATATDIKAAYRKLAKEWHPDRFHGDLIDQQKATEKFRQITEAYQALLGRVLERTIGVEEESRHTPGIKIEKISPDFYYELGIAKVNAGENQDAIEAFTQAIRCDENYLNAYQYRGFLLEKMGFTQRAEADFKKVKELKISSQFQTHPQPSGYEASQAKSSSKNVEHWHSEFISNANCVTAIALDAPAKLMVAGYENGRVYLWNQQQKKNIASYQGQTKAVRCLVFSPNDQRIYSAGDNCRIYTNSLTDTKSTLVGATKHQHSRAITALALSHDGYTLVSGSVDKTVKIWFLTKRVEPITLAGFASEITALTISPKDDFVAIASLDNNIRLRRLGDGKLLRSIPVNSSVASLSISPNGQFLAIGGFNHTITIWNLESNEKANILVGHEELVSSIQFLPDSQHLISVSWDSTIKLWDLDSGSSHTIGKHQDAILSCALSVNGKVLVTGGRDKRIGIWTCT